jgi:hypothetical protein
MPTVYPISAWYPTLGSYTFPTVFVHLTAPQRAALAAGTTSGSEVEAVAARLTEAIRSVPGSGFVHADVCAPTDAPAFAESAAVKNGQQAWAMLAASAKVREAFAQQQTERLGVHPYRRLDPVKEFRLFIYGRRLIAMSQMRLDRHYRRLAGRRDYLWHEAERLTAELADRLPDADLCMDVYLTSQPSLLLIDFNCWGPPTNPLLLRSWDQSFSDVVGLKLIPPPTQLKGNVEVSF